MRNLITMIAATIGARSNCEAAGNDEWFTRHTEALEALDLPSGSGFDAGSELDLDRSTSERVVLHTSFHHMDAHGGYDGWTHHKIIVTPSLVHGFDVRVTGRDRNGIKDYIGDTFHDLLDADAPTTDEENWREDSIQFPRLICELADRLSPEVLEEATDAMGLEIARVEELFSRAAQAHGVALSHGVVR